MTNYWEQPPGRAREVRWAVLQRAYQHNLSVATRKANWLTWSIALLGLETLFLIAWIVAASL